jgi:hypothetical protein
MKSIRLAHNTVQLICTNTEAQAIALLLNTSCVLDSLRKIWPRTFYSDPYSINPPYQWLSNAGIDHSFIPTGKKHNNGSKETVHGPCILTALIKRNIGHFRAPMPTPCPIPLESTKNLPVSKGEREIQRQLKRLSR